MTALSNSAYGTFIRANTDTISKRLQVVVVAGVCHMQERRKKQTKLLGAHRHSAREASNSFKCMFPLIHTRPVNSIPDVYAQQKTCTAGYPDTYISFFIIILAVCPHRRRFFVAALAPPTTCGVRQYKNGDLHTPDCPCLSRARVYNSTMRYGHVSSLSKKRIAKFSDTYRNAAGALRCTYTARRVLRNSQSGCRRVKKQIANCVCVCV